MVGTFPQTLPFRLTAGSLELKSTRGTFILIRNSSWSNPGTHASVIKNGEQTRPLTTNECTVLPYFMGFEWTSIDSNNGYILILGELARRLGTKVGGTTIDFTDWFRQFAVAKKGFWKASVLEKTASA